MKYPLFIQAFNKLFLTLFLGLLLFFGVRSTEASSVINYQGTLKSSTQTAVPDSAYTFTFKLYTQSSGGSAVWTETQSLTTSSGIFNTQLGSVATFPSNLFSSNPTLYLGITVNSDSEMTPRQRVGSSPYAFTADEVAFSGMRAAAQTNTLDNLSFAQTWNWSTISSGSGLSIGITNTGAVDTATLNLTTASTGTNAYALRVNDDGTYADSSPFVIDKDGNVGVGIVSPTSKLQVSGGTSTFDSIDFTTYNNRRFVFEGDSLTDATGLTGPTGVWPVQLSNVSSYVKSGQRYNVATSGQRVAQMTSQYTAQVSPYKPIRSTDDTYFFLWAGTNDIGNGDSSATIYANLKTLWANAKTNGFNVVAFTVTPRSDYTVGNGRETTRLALNNLILSDPTLYDYLVRPDVYFPTSSNTTYYSDGIHLTATANLALAKQIGSLLSQSYANGLFYTGGGLNSSGILVSQAGNVGIGTTTPSGVLTLGGDRSAAAWGLSGINLQTTAAIYTDTSSSGTTANNNVNSIAIPTLAASNTTTYTAASTLYIAGSPVAGANVTLSNPTALVVASGKVGFGTTTPQGLLTLAGNHSAPQWNTNGINLVASPATYTDTTASGTVANSVINSIGIPTIAASSTTLYNNAATLYIAGAPTAGTNVTINVPAALVVATGNVGIGTVSATNKLTVVESGNLAAATLTAANTSVDLLKIRSTAANGYSSIAFFDDGNTSRGGIGYSNSASGVFGQRMYLQSANKDIVFSTNGGTAAHMVIENGGEVGIGNSSPSYLLHVGSSTPVGIVARFQNSTGTCDINPTATALSCSSDETLKENIVSISESSLDKIKQLNPVSYSWKNDENHVIQTGFIAQSVRTIFPNLVSEDKDNHLLSLNYMGLIPYIIKAIQEFDTKLAALSELVNTKKVVTQELCVGLTCVTEDQFLKMIQQTGAQSTPIVELEPIPEEEEIETPEPPTTEEEPQATQENPQDNQEDPSQESSDEHAETNPSPEEQSPVAN